MGNVVQVDFRLTALRREFCATTLPPPLQHGMAGVIRGGTDALGCVCRLSCARSGSRVPRRIYKEGYSGQVLEKWRG